MTLTEAPRELGLEPAIHKLVSPLRVRELIASHISSLEFGMNAKHPRRGAEMDGKMGKNQEQ